MTSNDPIETITKTRQLGAHFLARAVKSLKDSNSVPEQDFHNTVIREMKNEKSVYPTGWYDPPPGGVSVLFSSTPFTRLQYDNLRDEKYWPNANFSFSDSSVGLIYCSPVDRDSSLIGDIGLTIYSGNDKNIRAHIRDCYRAILEVAEYVQVDMTMNDIFTTAMDSIFPKYKKHIGWMVTSHDPLGINLGHTVPGSYGDGILSGSFEEIRESIRTLRVYINKTEEFTIPSTSALTIEARLTDESEKMPNVFFHFIVAFKNGEKRILNDLDEIFEIFGMDYL